MAATVYYGKEVNCNLATTQTGCRIQAQILLKQTSTSPPAHKSFSINWNLHPIIEVTGWLCRLISFCLELWDSPSRRPAVELLN